MKRAVVSFVAVLLLLVTAVSGSNVKSPYSEDQMKVIWERIAECIVQEVPKSDQKPAIQCWVEGTSALRQGLKKEELTAYVTKCLKSRVPKNPAIHVSAEKCLSKAMALPV